MQRPVTQTMTDLMMSEARLSEAIKTVESGVPSRTPAVPEAEQKGQWRGFLRLLQGIGRVGRRAPRRLRLCESLPLGERRFVAVVEFDQSRFLLGGTSASLVLLARLGSDEGEGGRDDRPSISPERAPGISPDRIFAEVER